MGIIIDEHVHGFIPAAAENVPPISGLVPAPLLYVSCHVIGAVRVDSAKAANASADKDSGKDVSKDAKAAPKAAASKDEPAKK